MTQFSDNLFLGDAYYSLARSDRGLRLPNLFVKQFGAIAAAAASGVCVGVTATGAATLSATGSLTSGGVATFDVARNVSVTSTGNVSAVTFTVTGTDEYGETLSEAITGPNNTTVYGGKAFKTVTSVASSAAVAVATNVGSGTSYGLPVRIATKGDVVSVSVDGVPETTLTVVAGLSSTGTSTTTTADIRGIVTPNTAANGTKRFTALVVVNDPDTKAGAYGVSQA
jgi:hypothetical protein